MEIYTISFHSVEQINDFVHWAEKIPHDMDLSSGSIMIDAKSIQGVITFGLGKELTLTVYGELDEKDKMYIRILRQKK